MNELEKIEDKLHEAGFKLTPQRRATVELCSITILSI